MNQLKNANNALGTGGSTGIGLEPAPGMVARNQSKTHRSLKRPTFKTIVLLLQGGGALGAYQGGVYQALAEADLHPDWVAGISIGSINAAIIDCEHAN
jgi:predicted acylesterase/phospholipase RssA